MDQRTKVVLGRLAQGKVSVEITKALFLSYGTKVTFIHLTKLGPLRAW